MANSNEASVEEILESIKKVIARDNRDDAIATRKRRETHGVAETIPAAVEAAAAASEPDAADAMDTNDEVLDLGEMHIAEDLDASDADLSDELESVAPNAAPVGNIDENAALITDKARDSMRENLEALAMMAQPSMPPQIVRSGETSLEGLTRELLRPMLSDWLDANLPQMVETMVKEEIARIARKDS